VTWLSNADGSPSRRRAVIAFLTPSLTRCTSSTTARQCTPVEKQIVGVLYRVAASAAPTRSTSPVPGLNPVREKARLQLAERRFADLGKERETSEIYERVLRTERTVSARSGWMARA
jgi:hypothetical protein